MAIDFQEEGQFNWKIPASVQRERDERALAVREEELADDPTFAPLQKDVNYFRKQLGMQPKEVSTEAPKQVAKNEVTKIDFRPIDFQEEEAGLWDKTKGVAAGVTRFLGEGAAGAVAGGLTGVARGGAGVATGKEFMPEAMAGLESGQEAVKKGIDWTGFGTSETAQWTQKILGDVYEKARELGGEGASKLLSTTPIGWAARAGVITPEQYDAMERFVRTSGEVAVDVGLAEEGVRAVRPRTWKGSTPKADPMKAEVEKFLQERLAKEESDKVAYEQTKSDAANRPVEQGELFDTKVNPYGDLDANAQRFDADQAAMREELTGQQELFKGETPRQPDLERRTTTGEDVPFTRESKIADVQEGIKTPVEEIPYRGTEDLAQERPTRMHEAREGITPIQGIAKEHREGKAIDDLSPKEMMRQAFANEIERSDARLLGQPEPKVGTDVPNTGMPTVERTKTAGEMGIGRSQRGSVMSPGAILDAVRDSFRPVTKAVPDSGEFRNFRDALPKELQANARQLFDEFKSRKQAPVKNLATPSMDAVTKPLEGAMTEGLKGYVPELRDIDQVMPELQKSGDIGMMLGGKDFVAGGKLMAQRTKNAVVKYGVDVIAGAVRAKEAMSYNRLFHKDTGIVQVINRLTPKEQYPLMRIFTKYNGKKWLSTEELIREGLNDAQIHAYENYRTQMQQAWNDLNAARKERGLEALKPVEGYFPSRWSGRYYVRITDETGRLIGVEARRSRSELEGLKSHLEKNGKQVSEILVKEPIKKSKYGEAANTRDLFDQIAETIGRDSFEAEALRAIVDAYNEKQPGNWHFGKHLETKHGVGGYKGDMSGKDMKENFKEGMESIDGYMRDLYHFTEMQKAWSNISELVKPDNGIKAPNAKEYIQQYWDNAAKNENEFTAVTRRMMEAIPKAFGKDPALLRHAGQQIRRQVVLSMLGYWRPSFLLANFFQPMQMMTPAISELRSIRAPNESYKNSSMTALTKGWAEAMLPESQMSALAKEAVAFADKEGILHKQFMADINALDQMSSRSFYNSAWRWVNGEKPMAAMEGFARRAAYLQAVHALDGADISKADMFRAAGDIMDTAMTNYMHHEKSLAFGKSGEVGANLSPLQTFKLNWLSQRIKFAKHIATNPTEFKSYKPMAISLAMDFLFAGVMGTAFLQEADFAMDLLKKAGLLPADMDNATGFLLKHTAHLQGSGRDTVRYGIASGVSGLDFSPQFAMTKLIPHDLKDLLPIPARAAEIAGKTANWAGKEVTGRATSEDRANALSVLPGPMKAGAEALMMDEDGMIPNPNRNMEGKVRREGLSGWAGSVAGAPSINEKEQTTAVIQNAKIEAQITERKTKLMDKAKELYADGQDIGDLMDEYVELGGKPRDMIRAARKDAMMRSSTQYERAVKPARNLNALRQQMRLEDYGVRDE